jgi:hypothetical protein
MAGGEGGRGTPAGLRRGSGAGDRRESGSTAAKMRATKLGVGREPDAQVTFPRGRQSRDPRLARAP